MALCQKKTSHIQTVSERAVLKLATHVFYSLYYISHARYQRFYTSIAAISEKIVRYVAGERLLLKTK